MVLVGWVLTLSRIAPPVVAVQTAMHPHRQMGEKTGRGERKAKEEGREEKRGGKG
jgi:hypothetical protein